MEFHATTNDVLFSIVAACNDISVSVERLDTYRNIIMVYSAKRGEYTVWNYRIINDMVTFHRGWYGASDVDAVKEFNKRARR